VDVDPLGEGAAIGMAQLRSDDAGRLLIGGHRRGQRMPRPAPLGAEHQVQLDRLRRPAGFDPSQRYRLRLHAGETQSGLLSAVMAERLDRERWQGQDGAAGSGLDRPDRQFLALAARVGVGDGQNGWVDDGERLTEPDRAGVQVEVGPFQAAQLAVEERCYPALWGQDAVSVARWRSASGGATARRQAVPGRP
jgi:hypothetical protein